MMTYPFKVLDLFSGIGGFSLGLEATGGFETVAFCEICPKARKVLQKHWADVPIYEDVKTLTQEKLNNDGINFDVVTGGFPCQDISKCGKGEGIYAERSGLWSEMYRIIRNAKPKWAIIENVPALRSRGLALVLQNLWEIGYNAQWDCIPASAVGAPHQRDRIWIVAYPSGFCNFPIIRKTLIEWEKKKISYTESASRIKRGDTLLNKISDKNFLSYPMCEQQTERGQYKASEKESLIRGNIKGRSGSNAKQRPFPSSGSYEGYKLGEGRIQTEIWENESSVSRILDGIPNRVDRCKQLGNAVVPQIPELIGNAILEVEHGCFIGQE